MNTRDKLPTEIGLPIPTVGDEQPTVTETNLEAQPLVEAAPQLDWRQHALWDLRNTSMSYAEIGRKYNRARDTIVKLKQREKITRPPRAKSGPRPALEDNYISTRHQALGTRIIIFGDQNLHLNLGESFGVSAQVMKRLRHGCYDPSLSLLLRIAEVMNEPVQTLLEPYKVTATPKR